MPAGELELHRADKGPCHLPSRSPDTEGQGMPADQGEGFEGPLHFSIINMLLGEGLPSTPRNISNHMGVGQRGGMGWGGRSIYMNLLETTRFGSNYITMRKTKLCRQGILG